MAHQARQNQAYQRYQRRTRKNTPLNHRDDLDILLKTMQDALLCVALPNRQLICVSAAFEKIFGYPHELFMADPNFFRKVVHPDDLERTIIAMQTCFREGLVELDHRIILPDGQVRWLHRRAWINYDEDGRPIRVNDSARDITTRKRQELLQIRLSQVLEIVAGDAPLSDILHHLTAAVEEFQPDIKASVLLLDPSAGILHHGAAASLPIAYINAIDGLKIGSGVGSCGTAAFEKRLVIVEDIETDPLWLNFRDLAHQHNLRACWSQPILDHDKRVLGTFALYYETIRHPSDSELEFIRLVAHLAGVAIRRRQAEKELQSSEARYRSVIEDQTELIFRYDSDCKLTFVNQAYCQFYGQSSEAILGTSFLEKIPPEQRAAAVNTIKALTAAHPVSHSEHQFQIADGSFHWFEWTDRALFDAQGQFVEYQGVGRDITARRKAEAQLRLMEAAVQNSGDAIIITNSQMNIVFVNPAFTMISGTSAEDIVGKTPDLLMNLATDAEALKALHVAIASGATFTGELNTQHMNGNELVVEWATAPIRNEHGDITHFVTNLRDITARKQVEANLQKSEALFQQFMQHIPSNIFILDQDERLTYCNPQFAASLGKSIETILGKTVQEYGSPALAQIVHDENQAVFAQSDAVTFDYAQESSTGVTHWQVIKFIIPQSDGNPFIGAVSTNVTKQKQAEQALRASEEKYRSLVESSDAVIAMFDINGEMLYANKIAAHSLGLTPQAILGKTMHDLFPESIATQQLASIREVIQTGVGEISESPTSVQGTEYWYRTSIQPVRDEAGRIHAGLINSVDITDRKNAESALRASERKLNAMIQSQTNYVLRTDMEGRHTYWNQKFEQDFGWVYQEHGLMGGVGLESILNYHHQRARETVERCIAEPGKAFQVELDKPVANGAVYNTLWEFVCLTDSKGLPVEVQCVGIDITARVHAEKLIQASEKRYRQMFALHGLAKLLIVPDTGHIIDANAAAAQFYGIGLKTLKTRSIFDLSISPEDEVREAMVQARDLQIMSCQFIHRGADGTPRDVEIFTGPIEIDGKSVFYSIVTDITEKVRAKAALEEANNFLEKRVSERTAELERTKNRIEAIFNHSGDGILLLDVHNGIQQANHAFDTLFDTPSDSYLRMKLSSFFEVGNTTSIEDIVHQVAATHKTIHLEARTIFANRSPIDVEISISPVNRSIKDVTSLVCLIRDISARLQSERALRLSTQQLKESQQRLQLVLNTIPVRVFWKDRQSVLRGGNQLFAQDMGFSNSSEIIGKGHEDLHLIQSELDDYRIDDLAVMETNQPILDYEETITLITGEVIWAQTSKLPLRDEQGNVVGILGVYTDITARKQAAAELQQKHEQERQMQAFLKALHEISITLTRMETLDDFYRNTVEQGLQQFGFERMGLLLYDAATGIASGSYGTDAEGKLVDEHHLRIHPGDLTGILKRTLDRNERFAYDESAQLYANLVPIGTGMNAVAALWNGSVLGWLTIDNGVRYQPISAAQLDVLALYALTAGSLLARKKAEFALRDSEERYRLLAENVTDMISRYAPDGTFTFVTPASLRLTGYTPEELIGHFAYEYLHPDDFATMMQNYHSILDMPPVETVSHRFRRKNGAYVWIETTNHRMMSADGTEVIEVIGVSRDISERKDAELSLQILSQRLEMAAEAGNIGVWDWHQSDNKTIWDERMYNLYNTTAEAFNAGLYTWEDAVHPDDLRRVQAEMDASMREDIPFDTDYRLILPGQSVRFIKANAIVLRAADGTPERMVGVNMDITALKTIEQALIASLEKEKELGELKSRFVSMASHEFRTPLAAILATSETLAVYRSRMTEEQIDIRFGRIHHQVMHMKDIMEDVLQLARMQANRVEFNPTFGDLDALCLEIVEEYESQTETQRRIEYTSTSTPLFAFFDEHLMHQVISNLVGNALKYSAQEKSITVSLVQNGESIVLTVKDKGIGIPPEDLKYVFEPFHRAKNVGTISGTGLGLSIAKQAVERHGCTLTVDSIVGVGTTFILTVPIVSMEDEPHD